MIGALHVDGSPLGVRGLLLFGGNIFVLLQALFHSVPEHGFKPRMPLYKFKEVFFFDLNECWWFPRRDGGMTS